MLCNTRGPPDLLFLSVFSSHRTPTPSAGRSRPRSHFPSNDGVYGGPLVGGGELAGFMAPPQFAGGGHAATGGGGGGAGSGAGGGTGAAHPRTLKAELRPSVETIMNRRSSPFALVGDHMPPGAGASAGGAGGPPHASGRLASKGNASWVQAYINAGLQISGGVANTAMRVQAADAAAPHRLRVYKHQLPWEFNELYLRCLSMLVVLDRQKMMVIVDELWKDAVEHANDTNLQQLLWNQVQRAQEERDRVAEGNQVWEERYHKLEAASRKACDDMEAAEAQGAAIAQSKAALDRDRQSFGSELQLLKEELQNCRRENRKLTAEVKRLSDAAGGGSSGGGASGTGSGNHNGGSGSGSAKGLAAKTAANVKRATQAAAAGGGGGGKNDAETTDDADSVVIAITQSAAQALLKERDDMRAELGRYKTKVKALTRAAYGPSGTAMPSTKSGKTTSGGNDGGGDAPDAMPGAAGAGSSGSGSGGSRPSRQQAGRMPGRGGGPLSKSARPGGGTGQGRSRSAGAGGGRRKGGRRRHKTSSHLRRNFAAAYGAANFPGMTGGGGMPPGVPGVPGVPVVPPGVPVVPPGMVVGMAGAAARGGPLAVQHYYGQAAAPVVGRVRPASAHPHVNQHHQLYGGGNDPGATASDAAAAADITVSSAGGEERVADASSAMNAAAATAAAAAGAAGTLQQEKDDLEAKCSRLMQELERAKQVRQLAGRPP